MVIIFIHDFQNKKLCKATVRYLAKISQLMYLTISAKLHTLMNTRQRQREPVLKTFLGRWKSLKNIAS